MAELVRIVPAPNQHGGPTLTRGTKVYAGDTEIDGVFKIEVIADLNSVWRAVLHVHVTPLEIQVLADTHHYYFWPIWARIKAWWQGYKVRA